MKRPAGLVAVLIVAVCLMAAGLFYLRSDLSEQRTGDALGPYDSGWAASFDVDYTFTNGWLYLINNSDESVKLVEVKPVFSGDGLELVGTRVLGPDRTLIGIQHEPRFPPTDPGLGTLREVKGFTLTSRNGRPPSGAKDNSGTSVMVGLKVVKPGRSTIKAFDVTYEQGGEFKVQRIGSTLAVCAPKTKNHCPQEPGFN